MTPPDDRIPVLLVTGFLGSGKTTLLNHLLKHPAMAKSLVVVNEFGEIGIDHLLVSAPSENILLMDNGCLCCVLQGELKDTFVALYSKRARGDIPAFDRIILETTGLADPVPVMQTIVADGDVAFCYRLEAVVTLVDALHGAHQLEHTPESIKQAAVADILLISKTDLAGDAEIADLTEKLSRINPTTLPVEVDYEAFDVSPFLAGETRMTDRAASVEKWLRATSSGEHHVSSPNADGRDHHTDRLNTFSIAHDVPVTRRALVMWMNLLADFRGRDLLRVKGLVNVDGKPVVIHIVQTVVHEPIELECWPNADRRSRVVFITRNITRDDIAPTLEALAMSESVDRPAHSIDREAYAGFLRLAKTLTRG